MTSESSWAWAFGRFNLQSLPFTQAIDRPDISEIIGAAAASVVIIGAVVMIALITWFGKWGVLWSNWLTSTDHKRIGIMYVVLSLVMLARGVLEGVIMRTQQAFGIDGGSSRPITLPSCSPLMERSWCSLSR